MRFFLFKIPFSLLALVSICSCTSKEQTTAHPIEIQHADDPSLPFDVRLKQFIERKLHITQSEKYKLKIYREHLNDDQHLDLIITVNRFENALKIATQNNQVRQAEALGFFGSHNFFIYYNSKTNSFSDPIVVASSPKRELDVSFEHISSDTHKDLVIDYTIRNSQFRKIYLFIENKPTYVFHWKLYDGWGTDKLEAYCFKYMESSHVSSVRDILVYAASMENIDKEDDYYAFRPKIKCSDLLIKRFFYNPTDKKYYTHDLN